MKNLVSTSLFFILLIATNVAGANDKLNNQECFFTLNGIEHYVKISGAENKTTPIIIVHGGPGGNNYNFEKTIGPHLEKFAPVVYYDQRGCGRSKAAKDTNDYTITTLISDLDCLRESLGLEEMTLLGYSFGAELSLRYTKAHPKRVKQLIISSPAELSTSVFLVQLQGFYSIANQHLRHEIEEILKQDKSVKEKFLSIWNIVPQSVVDSFLFVNQYIANLNRKMWEESKLPSEGTVHFQNVIFENSKGDLLESVRGLDTECLIISGIFDKNGGFQTGIELNKVLTNSNLLLYEKSAHFPDMEESERFANDVKKFVLRN
ncbi:alpha/beta fold hydrolase [Draconibacterium halophilum]|uniref:Alpha/beta fold hydrolase n=1 Tax=Draconibacterium halophilum TaxID=2706887 RepID=A0A6C0RAP1_9BACT|nr:alpha/beta fold hydrolase [Draconibacterium halophilum]QIA07450.1 alpha/beta fold hydrolase [Draconibacterium halophilum]